MTVRGFDDFRTKNEVWRDEGEHVLKMSPEALAICTKYGYTTQELADLVMKALTEELAANPPDGTVDEAIGRAVAQVIDRFLGSG